ncbi:DUF4145 domain-containing protein [Saccharophagus degradans]|uniref:Methyl-accepting chemotaxis sensory transducer n=1 Tax=Saccharophagus degradans (strain 2-40 / ATCC 43961 / DSM 17024) TaxID=203122 RepID=Q21G43_SACD2|nr:DUF4145 domain-containing protein [Saccharophagus degradans]ABD82336.1 methyl-accepting chemotaxis sensory transducer [Saccharophagus degradans 2-40]
MKLSEAEEGLNKHVHDLIDICPHCGAKSHIEKQWSGSHVLANRDAEFYVVFRCKPCRRLILKTFYLRQNEYSQHENFEMKGWDEKFPAVIDDQIGNEDVAFIDENVLADYKEALKCMSIGADKAACSMFRRALQLSLVVLGANPKDDLIKQINSLASLPGDIKDWAHQIRIFGNWGAHPDRDNLKNIEATDSEEVHDFVSKFFMYTFIMPEKVKLSRIRRDEKLKGNDDSEK